MNIIKVIAYTLISVPVLMILCLFVYVLGWEYSLAALAACLAAVSITTGLIMLEGKDIERFAFLNPGEDCAVNNENNKLKE